MMMTVVYFLCDNCLCEALAHVATISQLQEIGPAEEDSEEVDVEAEAEAAEVAVAVVDAESQERQKKKKWQDGFP